MGIFRRRKTTDSQDETLDTVDEGKPVDTADATGRATDTPESASGPAAPEPADGAAEPPGSPTVERAWDRATDGPFDRSEVEDSTGRLDLGGMWLNGVKGMELRLEVEEKSKKIVGATCVVGDSAVQMQAFAAPKTLGVWDEIRSEIAEGLVKTGGTADEVDGPIGTELRCRMPGRSKDGRVSYQPARFLGVDGPRWFLRAVVSGKAATDEQVAAPLLSLVRETVVVRGEEAMAPRALLPLRLPQSVVEANGARARERREAEESGTAEGSGEAGPVDEKAAEAARRRDELKPFERGPEITEIR